MSRLISKDQVDGLAQPLVTLNLCDVEQQARAAVDHARAEARKTLAEAVARARQMERVAAARGEKAGYDAGFKKGREAGRAEAFEAEKKRLEEATASVRQALIEVLTQLESQRHQVLADAKHGLLELSIAIAERICRTRFQSDGSHLAPLIADVIDMTGRQGGLVLRINPADREAVERFLADVHDATSGGDAALVRLVADDKIERGGCVAERTCGKVDAQLQTQIGRIVAELTGAAGAPPGPLGTQS